MTSNRLGELRTTMLGDAPKAAKPAKAAKATAAKATAKAPASGETVDAALPPRGQREHYKKLTITIDPAVLDMLKDEKRRREKAGTDTEVTVGGLLMEAAVRCYGGK